ncbi:MAG: hypothetical protein IJV00_05680 [Clostridia bacterium]|nr:hypothetical protein [Clostridia bacterium]
MVKKLVALTLIFAALVCSLTSCAVDLEDKGPVIRLYLTTEPANLDPAVMIYDKNTIKYTGVMFEGLTKINNNRIEKGIASSWRTDYDQEKGEFKLEITLETSKWNDGRTLSADQFSWAWKRILSPETDSPAAALLFDIKNAKAAKAGDVSIDSVGIAAVSQTILEIEFEKPIDVELFLEAIASPALYPVRDDVAGVEAKVDTWARTGTDDMLSDGGFALKGRENGGLYRLEMSSYYRGLNTQIDGFMKFVKPFRLLTDYSVSLDDQLALFDAGEIYYVGELSKENYANREKDLKTQDLLSSYTYFFDCSNPVLSNASVRKALSTALDRTQIASIIGRGTKAAKGFVTYGVYGSSLGRSFRDEAGDVYGTTADVSAAKSLLASAGVSGGSFSLTYRTDRDYDLEVAQYAKSVWEGLGFKVTLVGLDRSEYETALYAGDWDVIALDYQGLTTSAYSYLAPFATRYSGSVVSVADDSIGYTPHVTNFANDQYDALVDSILEKTNRADRAKILVELEKLFADQAPACALCFYTDYYLVSNEMKNLKSNQFGYRDFSEVLLNNYQKINEVYYSVVESIAESSNAAAAVA